jgi:hypothetical protein
LWGIKRLEAYPTTVKQLNQHPASRPVRNATAEFKTARLAPHGLQTRSCMEDDSTYVCDACGEEIVIPIDLSAGHEQRYVEDCPVCCRPNIVHLEIDEFGHARSWSEPEST